MSRVVLSGLLCAGLVSGAQAATAWDESINGDFANLGTSPTAVTLVAGSNLVIGTTGRTAGVVDRDYFTVTLPAGWQLDTLTLLSGTSVLGTQELGFIAVQSGPQVTVNPTGGSPAGLLGWHHYTLNDIDTDILPLVGLGFGATGFSGPLPAGTYSFWVQETATGIADYRFDFGVSVVPEPSLALMMLGGLGVLSLLRRR